MGSCLSSLLGSSREIEALPIETAFKMPSPMPSWPPGDGFAKGSIDLGGLEVRQISTFTKVWASDEGGGDDLGATFFAPSSVPDGFFVLGSYTQPNNRLLFGWVLVAKDTSSDGDHLAKPVDYLLVWSSESSNIKAGLVLQGDNKLGIGIRNDTARGKEMDTGAKFQIVSAEYLGPSNAVSEPPWLNYMREWGPKISYDIAKELAKVGRFLPKKLRSSLENLVKGLPDEVLGEEGPTGPKVKASWNMDETIKS